jgi:hypothetical protein
MVAQAVARAVLSRSGGTFAVMMSRQAGKNETSAQLEAYLMNVFQRVGGFIVKASPTFKPQTINSIMRLDVCLDNPWNRGRFYREKGYMTRLGNARCVFFSAQPASNVVGATASILLECDEAQEVSESKWNKDFRPMGASTNVVTVLWGTAWTSQTLLARTMASLRRLEHLDGRKRVFKVPWERVAEEVPAYGDYVTSEIQRLGRKHPLVKTQYFLEEIDGEGGMFPQDRQAGMHGDHQRYREGIPDHEYALLVDVAGEDEEVGTESGWLCIQPNGEPGGGLGRTRRDYTAITIVEVDRSTRGDPLIAAPTYRVVDRYSMPERVKPFVFSASSKSELGWSFLAVCDTGRFKDHADDGSTEYAQFWREVDNADYEILDGPGKRMRWGVWNPEIHDDLLISAAMCALLDDAAALYVDSAVVEAQDVL